MDGFFWFFRFMLCCGLSLWPALWHKTLPTCTNLCAWPFCSLHAPLRRTLTLCKTLPRPDACPLQTRWWWPPLNHPGWEQQPRWSGRWRRLQRRLLLQWGFPAKFPLMPITLSTLTETNRYLPLLLTLASLGGGGGGGEALRRDLGRRWSLEGEREKKKEKNFKNRKSTHVINAPFFKCSERRIWL